jgi:hypothetical protein
MTRSVLCIVSVILTHWCISKSSWLWRLLNPLLCHICQMKQGDLPNTWSHCPEILKSSLKRLSSCHATGGLRKKCVGGQDMAISRPDDRRDDMALPWNTDLRKHVQTLSPTWELQGWSTSRTCNKVPYSHQILQEWSDSSMLDFPRSRFLDASNLIGALIILDPMPTAS